jgi:hypothetical protein
MTGGYFLAIEGHKSHFLVMNDTSQALVGNELMLPLSHLFSMILSLIQCEKYVINETKYSKFIFLAPLATRDLC